MEFLSGPITDTLMVVLSLVLNTLIWKMTFDCFEPIDIEKMAAAHVGMVLNGLKEIY